MSKKGQFLTAQKNSKFDVNENKMAENKHLSFGRRFGYEPVENTVQTKEMVENIRTGLWNAYYLVFYKGWTKLQSHGAQEAYIVFHTRIWIYFLKKRVELFSRENIHKELSTFFYVQEIYKIYEFVEFLISESSVVIQSGGYKPFFSAASFVSFITPVLSENLAGYAIIENHFVPITNETEIAEIGKLKENTEKLGLKNIRVHLQKAIDLLAKKPIPDYANSMKESISMVEAICTIIEPSGKTLGDALKKIDNSGVIKMHPALRAGFSNLYGYTSDGSGIRHPLALGNEADLSVEDASYFLVSCSAFTNYLIQKAQKAGIFMGR
jgi:hypothetical protein